MGEVPRAAGTAAAAAASAAAVTAGRRGILWDADIHADQTSDTEMGLQSGKQY